MKQYFKPRILFAIVTLAFFASDAMAQSNPVVSFTRPGDSDIYCAYLADFVDIMPSYPNGEVALNNFITRERQYPRDAYENGVDGRVKCAFIVDTDGSILNVTVLKAPCPSLGNEAARIIRSMPRWESGKIDDTSVPVYYVMYITFRL